MLSGVWEHEVSLNVITDLFVGINPKVNLKFCLENWQPPSLKQHRHSACSYLVRHVHALAQTVNNEQTTTTE